MVSKLAGIIDDLKDAKTSLQPEKRRSQVLLVGGGGSRGVEVHTFCCSHGGFRFGGAGQSNKTGWLEEKYNNKGHNYVLNWKRLKSINNNSVTIFG
jgi:hypothetical protein